ncbi:MAG: ABC transporter ATP-binding protein [Patescibacteria group bacterium]|nr:ABC transporter ATP-binding protein [Patescibacteria group bacterium]
METDTQKALPGSAAEGTAAAVQAKTSPEVQVKPNVVIKGLDVIYNQGKTNEVRSLEGINLEIFPQEYVIIYGPSGCGKSTLLYSIAGLQQPTHGTVVVDQQDINNYGKKEIAQFHRQTIGMIFQSFYLIGTLNVLENVCLPKTFAGKIVREIREEAMKLLDRYHISNQAYKFPSELSGGQKQRVAVARSLINNPDIILADEPVGNLDSKSAHVVMTMFRELNEVEKKTIILVTHDPSHLQSGDKIVHMVDGKIVRIELKGKRDPDVDSYIFREGRVREDMTQGAYLTREYIPTNLRLLMQSFKGMTSDRVGNLLVPFKAQQLFSHLFFTMTNDQIEKAMKKLENFLYFKDNFHDFFKELDLPIEEGGAGWDKRLAKRFSDNVKQLVYQSGKINFSDKNASARDLADYVNSRLELKFDQATLGKLSGIILDRLGNYIGRDEFRKLLDKPVKEHGLGFDKRVAEKIAKEIELLLLLRY